MLGTIAVSICFMPSRPWKAESGWTSMALMEGLYSFSLRVVPVKVPLVPTAATKCVMRPSVCRQISGPVPW